MSYRATAIGAVMVAMGALVALAIVAKVQSADSLSVIALAMAIIALLVQLGVMAFEITASKASEIRAEQIFAQTSDALTRIEGRTTEARDLVREQLVPALRAGLSEFPQVAADVAEGGDSEAGAEKLLESITASIEHAADEIDSQGLQSAARRRLIREAGAMGDAQESSPGPKATGAHRLGLKAGDQVSHPTFGRGVIERIDGTGDKAVATIQFKNTTATKQLLLSWAPLAPVDPEDL